MHTHTRTKLHLTPSPEVELGYCRCVLCAHCAIKRWSGVRAAERVLCGDEENAGHAPQTPSVSLLHHALMRHLCESWPSVRLSLTLVPPVTALNNNNNRPKNALSTQSGSCFTSVTALSCLCVSGQQMLIQLLLTVAEGDVKKKKSVGWPEHFTSKTGDTTNDGLSSSFTKYTTCELCHIVLVMSVRCRDCTTLTGPGSPGIRHLLSLTLCIIKACDCWIKWPSRPCNSMPHLQPQAPQLIWQDAASVARLQLTIARLGEQKPTMYLIGHGGCAGTPTVPVWPL